MKQAMFLCHPWDLEHDGVELAVARLAGEVGVDTMTVTASCAAVEEFRARPGQGPRTIRLAAGLHFQPTAGFYANARIKPALRLGSGPAIHSRRLPRPVRLTGSGCGC